MPPLAKTWNQPSVAVINVWQAKVTARDVARYAAALAVLGFGCVYAARYR